MYVYSDFDIAQFSLPRETATTKTENRNKMFSTRVDGKRNFVHCELKLKIIPAAKLR